MPPLEEVSELETKIDGKFTEVLSKIEALHRDFSDNRLEFVKTIFQTQTEFNTRVTKLEEKITERRVADKKEVEKDMQLFAKEFAAYQIKMEGRVTAIGVKVGLISSVAASIIVALIVTLVKN
jgi:hypothetical protein